MNTRRGRAPDHVTAKPPAAPPRRLLAGCCTWCGHEPHPGTACPSEHCPCARHNYLKD